MTATSTDAGLPSTAGETPWIGRISWVLFEWARNPYVLVITVYVYATYFTRDIVGDPVRGHAKFRSAGRKSFATIRRF